MFLGRPLQVVGQGGGSQEENSGVVGCVPEEMLEEQHSEVLNWHETKADIVSKQHESSWSSDNTEDLEL